MNVVPHAKSMSKGQINMLTALIESGPLHEQNIGLPYELKQLVNAGYAMRAVVQGNDQWYVATLPGRDAYCAYFDGPTILEAHANRLAQIFIWRAKVNAGGH